MGVEAKYHVTGKIGGGSLVLASASPGILLIICGSVLVGLCFLRPFEVGESRPVMLPGAPALKSETDGNYNAGDNPGYEGEPRKKKD